MAEGELEVVKFPSFYCVAGVGGGHGFRVKLWCICGESTTCCLFVYFSFLFFFNFFCTVRSCCHSFMAEKLPLDPFLCCHELSLTRLGESSSRLMCDKPADGVVCLFGGCSRRRSSFFFMR